MKPKKNQKKKTSVTSEKTLDTLSGDPVISAVTANEASAIPPTEAKKDSMNITFTRNDKPRKVGAKWNLAVYNAAGYRGSIRISKAFLGDNAPATFTSDEFSSILASPAPAKVKIDETKEERKARLASLPKLTQAEKVAKMEARLAKAKAKLERAAA